MTIQGARQPHSGAVAFDRTWGERPRIERICYLVGPVIGSISLAGPANR
jgi:hypothetical protein